MLCLWYSLELPFGHNQNYKETKMTETAQQKVKSGKSFSDFAKHVLEGLSQNPKQLSSKYFYDDEGSRLFQEIMKVPEYYPTGCEQAIIETRAEDITKHLFNEFDCIDLGAGDSAKVVPLLLQMKKIDPDFVYYAVDISKASAMQRERNIPNGIKHVTVTYEYLPAVQHIQTKRSRQAFVMLLGSNIGNFPKAEAIQFLKKLISYLYSGDLLFIGFDLVKEDREVMHRAYSDSAGITARFNMNLLTRMNRELGANFKLENFRHQAWFDEELLAMRSALVSTIDQNVYIDALKQDFTFHVGEGLHTEMSCKYTLDSIAEMAMAARCTVLENYLDSKDWFCNLLWRVL